MRREGTYGCDTGVNPFCNALNDSKKPIVAVVRGGCIGIAFTTLSLVDFVYTSPDAFF